MGLLWTLLWGYYEGYYVEYYGGCYGGHIINITTWLKRRALALLSEV